MEQHVGRPVETAKRFAAVHTAIRHVHLTVVFVDHVGTFVGILFVRKCYPFVVRSIADIDNDQIDEDPGDVRHEMAFVRNHTSNSCV